MRSKILLSITFLIFVFSQSMAAQNIFYPNEIRGFSFFGSGKLKALKLGVSSKEDVKRLFGESCENECEYNNKWSVEFSYIEPLMTWTTTVGDKTTQYIPAPASPGKLYSIKLTPKSRISIRKAILLSKFGNAGNGGEGPFYEESDEYHIFFDVYSDKYGLMYKVFKESSHSAGKHPLKWRKGDLFSVEYQLPDKIEKRMFVEQKDLQ